MLINIVVPTSEQWQDLQDSFQDDILDKFHITSMSFNNDLTYDWGVITSVESSAPVISLGEWGSIDLQYINDLLNTPISFGYVITQFGQWEPQNTNIPTEGLTMRNILNFMLILELAIMNVALYNKFFNKGE